jgi:MFS family permease
MVQSAGSSGTIALSIAVTADIATSAERGKYYGYATAGILLGPAFGPVIGGALSEYLGWRSIFWFLVIFSAVFLFLFLVFFPETCRKVVGNGSIPARGINKSFLGYIQGRREKVPAQAREEQPTRKGNWIPNPLSTLRIFTDKESALLLAYNGLAFTPNMLVTASLPSMLTETYGYNELQVGLCYLPFGFGALSASIVIGYLIDWNFRRHAKRVGLNLTDRQPDLTNFPLERARIEVILPNHFFTLISIVAYGWVMQYARNIAGPEILLLCIGFFITSAFNVSNTLLADLHRDTPAATGAATNLARCFLSAGGVAFILPLINAVGRGWAFTIVGVVYILLTPTLFILMKNGPMWRAAREQAKEARKAQKEGEKQSSNLS